MSARKSSASRVRIKDVARHARVSVGTASHVLSGRVQVSAPLRARVQKAIDALGYVPNFHAQRLRRSLSRVLGICLPHTSTSPRRTTRNSWRSSKPRLASTTSLPPAD